MFSRKMKVGDVIFHTTMLTPMHYATKKFFNVGHFVVYNHVERA